MLSMDTDIRLKRVLVILTLVIAVIGLSLIFSSNGVVRPPGTSHSGDLTPTIPASATLTPVPSISDTDSTINPSDEPSSTTTDFTEETTDTSTVEPTIDPIPTFTPSDSMEIGPLPTAVQIDGDGDRVSILAGGDILFHSYLINGGLEADGTYNYDASFKHLLPLTADIDISYVNMEGTLAGPPYTGFPLFSAPDSVATSIRNAGFNMVTSANNHSIDKGTAGVIRTVDILRDEGLVVSGTRKSLDEPYYELFNVGGVDVALATITYETIRQEGRRGLNGIVIPSDAEGLVQSFSQEEPYMSEDFLRYGRLAKRMRDNGAEIVIFNVHWGTEYSTDQNWYQETLAQVLADNDVDLIIGGGPHAIQPIVEVQSKLSSHKTLVYYSVGNLLSDQLYSTADSNGLAEDGLLAEVHFLRDKSGKMRIDQAHYIMTYCFKDKFAQDKTKNTIIPVQQALENPEAYGMENHVNLLQASLNRTSSIMAKNQVLDTRIDAR